MAVAASVLLEDKMALKQVSKKNAMSKNKFLFFRPLKNGSLLILKNDKKTQQAAMSDNKLEPKGKQKQKSIGKK